MQRPAEGTEQGIEILTHLIIGEEHLDGFCVADAAHRGKELYQLRIGAAEIPDGRHHIDHDALQIAAVEVLQTSATVHVHGGVELFNQAAVIDYQAVVLALVQAVCPRDGLQKAVLLELLVDVEHLTQRRVEAGEQLAAHDQNVDFTIAEPVLDGFLVAVGIPVLLHHLVPEGDD